MNSCCPTTTPANFLLRGRQLPAGGRVGGRAYSFFACLRDLTIDHASLSRRSTVPTPNRDTSNFGRSLRFFHVSQRNCLLILSPSCFAVCGRHLSPRKAIVISLLSSLPNSSMSHSSISPCPLRGGGVNLLVLRINIHISRQ